MPPPLLVASSTAVLVVTGAAPVPIERPLKVTWLPVTVVPASAVSAPEVVSDTWDPEAEAMSNEPPLDVTLSAPPVAFAFNSNGPPDCARKIPPFVLVALIAPTLVARDAPLLPIAVPDTVRADPVICPPVPPLIAPVDIKETGKAPPATNPSMLITAPGAVVASATALPLTALMVRAPLT